MQSLKKLFKKGKMQASKENTAKKSEITQWHGPKYIICFPDKNNPFIPYYYIEGEMEKWIKAPSNGTLYYDPIEDSAEFKNIVKIVNKLVDEEMGEDKGHMGSCHRAWAIKKRILKEHYGIEWHSVSDLNPGCMFD